jgi:hypothetical protein
MELRGWLLMVLLANVVGTFCTPMLEGVLCHAHGVARRAAGLLIGPFLLLLFQLLLLLLLSLLLLAAMHRCARIVWWNHIK